MTAYRFCRTDDRALLIDAYEACRGLEHAGEPSLDVPAFKRLVRDQGLWCSSCLVAFEGREPVGVLLGAKRDAATQVMALRVAPAHRRRGHGRHLLTSLSQKLAILGPPRLLAEVPVDSPPTLATFQACGWEPDATFRDWRRLGDASPLGVGFEVRAALSPVTVQDLNFQSSGVAPVSDGSSPEATGPAAPRPWARDFPTLEKLADQLGGLAFHSPDRLEAWALWLPPPEPGATVELLAMGAAPGELGRLGLRAIVDELTCLAPGSPLELARVSPAELDPVRLADLGFGSGQEFLRFTHLAQPA